MADESMIPLDQEYGQRQETKQLMSQAGQPAGQNRQTPAPAAQTRPRQAGAGAPADFLLGRQPTYPPDWTPPDPLDNLRRLAQTSPNVYVRTVLAQMLEGK